MKFDMSDMISKVASHESKFHKALLLYGETAGKKLEGIAKKNAPWKTQSGRARDTITGGADKEQGGARIYLSGNMSYSKYLELPEYMGDRYAVLEPTIKDNEKAILVGLKVVMQ